jgi:hypothetical protein
MFGDEGWYGYSPERYAHGALDLYYWSLDEEERARVKDHPWVQFINGENPDYPETALRSDFERIRQRIEMGVTKETMTLDTRLSDNPNPFNPVTIGTLIRLMMGGLPTGINAFPLHARVRYFDPVKQRAGIPEDVAALVEKLTPDETVINLVNTNQTEARSVIMQGGGYGEHQILSAEIGGTELEVNGVWCTVRLAAGCGGRVTLKMKRYANAPTMMLPWD